MGERGISELISFNKFGQFFDDILSLDPKIRFVATYDGSFKAKYQKGINAHIREDEIKQSLSEAQFRWDLRKQWSFRLGNPRYAMAQYDKVNRITIPFGEGLLMVSTETDADIPKLIEQINIVCMNFFA